jgi:hypothetical protein
VKLIRLLTFDEYATMVEEAKTKGCYSNDRRMFAPGLIIPNPWVFDPSGNRERLGQHVMIRAANKGRIGSCHRIIGETGLTSGPPLTVICPNGEWWEIDRTSSNGDGWKVEYGGGILAMTCSPSIVTTGYHGFLRNGEFTADLEGRGPNGSERP